MPLDDGFVLAVGIVLVVVLIALTGWRETHSRASALTRRVHARQEAGETEEAVELIRQTLAEASREACPWALVNAATDSLVTAGLYQEALRVPDAWSEDARERGRKQDSFSLALTRINQAEALHNLGSNERALEALQAVESLAKDYPMALHGLRCLRAWILVHLGRLTEARAEAARVNVGGVPTYRAEVSYTWAAIERESGNLDEALKHAEAGLRAAWRAPSYRNGLFMVAGIAALAGEPDRAHALFKEAVHMVYRRQGGDGLLRFAAFLDGRGDHEGAIRARRLAVERDPESVFAQRAREALGEA